MAANNGSRKRNQKSKASSHQKNSQGDNLRIRDQGVQQQWEQQPPLLEKQASKLQPQQQYKQQQQQQQQHPQQPLLLHQKHHQQQFILQHQQQYQQQQQQQQQQQSNLTSSKTTGQGTSIETPSQNNNIKHRNTGPEIPGKRKHNTKTAQDNINNISLHAAIFWHRHDLVESLLQTGSTAWETDQHGNTAFMTACKVGDVKLMTILWDSAPSTLNLQHSNREGDTVLHMCAGTGQEESCRFLISRLAKVNSKNKIKDTPLHLAAKNDHISICNMLVNSVLSSSNDSQESHRFILEENDKEQTAICVSILHQRAQITRMLLDMLTPEEQAIYLTSRLHRALKETMPVANDLAGAAIPGIQEVFLHGLLVSLSVLLICFTEKFKQGSSEFNIPLDKRVDHCLSNTKIIEILIGIASNRYVNKQIVPISCFLLIYLMEGIPENNGIPNIDETKTMGENIVSPLGRKFLEQFLNNNGPNDFLLKVNNNMELSEPCDCVITIPLALTIVSLIRSTLGRSWLESNRSHLTFVKEILLQNRSILLLLTTTCPLLTITYLESISREFVKQVELLEARDREQNLAELLWEEERDRKRRERKKHKQQQKKQHANKDTETKNISLQTLQIIEVSSDDEMCYHLTDNKLVVRDKPELFVEANPVIIDETKLPDDFKANNADGCQVQMRDSTCNNLDDDNSSTGSESHFIKSEKENTVLHLTTDEPFKFINNANDASKKDKEIVMNIEHLTSPVEKFQDKESEGTISTMMRWADVAKLGCSISEKSSCSSPGNYPSEKSDNSAENLGNWPLSSSIKKVGFNEENFRVTGNMTEMDTAEFHLFEDTLYRDENEVCSTIDGNSDEETSSCSSSSVESHSLLHSNSVLQNRNLSVTLESKTNRGVLTAVPQKNATTIQTATTCSISPSRGRRKRRKSKQSQKSEEEKADVHCWVPQKDKSKLYMSSDGFNFEDNHVKTKSLVKPLTVAVESLMVKSRSENAPNSTWSGMGKTVGPIQRNPDKNMDSLISSQKFNPKQKEIVVSNFRSDIPAILPPLKIGRELSNCKELIFSSISDDTQPDENNEVSGVELRNQLMTTQKRQPFGSKNTPLTGIKSNGVLVNKMKTASIHTSSNTTQCDVSSLRQGETLTCSNLPTRNHSSPVTQPLLSTLTMAGQYTPPPPGFQLIKQPVSVQTVKDIVNLDKSMQSYNKLNCKNEDNAVESSLGKKGRVITTVLLDKVKNPPISLQQENKIPSLSTLAWNCGQESKVAWSKLLQPKPATTAATSVLGNVPAQPAFSTSLGQTNVASLSNKPSEFNSSAELGKIDPHNTMTFARNATVIRSNFQTCTFSTILMNRMQQRSHNRDSIDFFEIVDGKPEKDKNIESAFPKNCTTSILDVTMSSLKSCETSSRQYLLDNPNINHPSMLYNQCNFQVQPAISKTEIRLQPRVSFRENVSKITMESMGLTPSSQNIGKRQPVKHKSDSRCSSPPVFFPEQIRDQIGSTNVGEANFPAFHEVHTSDFLSEMFSDPLFTDNIAVNQIRQKVQSSQSSTERCEIDLDYYASLYQMKFRDVLGNLPGQSQPQLRGDKQTNLTGIQGLNRQNCFKDRKNCQDSHAIFGSQSLSGSHADIPQTRRHSVRWHRSLQKVLDLLWTTRKQYGSIILPHPIPDYSIGTAGNVLISVGFLIDGTEIAVFIVDKSLIQISPCVVEIISSPEMDKHCLTRCKAFSEAFGVQYIAIDLYEYNLCEYLQVCLTACNQNTTVDLYIGLVLQLLQALGFLHHKLYVPHGQLAPCWIFINADGHLRLAGLGITTSGDGNKQRIYSDNNLKGYEYRTSCWGPPEELIHDLTKPSFYNDIRAAGKLAYFILTKGQHLLGAVAPVETEINVMRDHLSSEAFDLISPMLISDPKSQPSVDQCLKHPIFWSGDKKFRLILIVGSDVLTEMRTGIALTGTGAPTMMEILSLIDINMVSPNWIHEVDSTVLKEMKSFRVYKNNLAELTLFVYNCCLHFDKLSNSAKEVLDDPCKYFQNLFPSLFIAIYRSLKSSDRTDRTCYKPFF